MRNSLFLLLILLFASGYIHPASGQVYSNIESFVGGSTDVIIYYDEPIRDLPGTANYMIEFFDDSTGYLKTQNNKTFEEGTSFTYYYQDAELIIVLDNPFVKTYSHYYSRTSDSIAETWGIELQNQLAAAYDEGLIYEGEAFTATSMLSALSFTLSEGNDGRAVVDVLHYNSEVFNVSSYVTDNIAGGWVGDTSVVATQNYTYTDKVAINNVENRLTSLPDLVNKVVALPFISSYSVYGETVDQLITTFDLFSIENTTDAGFSLIFGFPYSIEITDQTVELKVDDKTFIINPYLQLNESAWLSLVKIYQNDELLGMMVEEIVIQDESLTLDGFDMVTSFPFAYMAQINHTGVDDYQDNGMPVCFNLFGYVFNDDYTVERGVGCDPSFGIYGPGREELGVSLWNWINTSDGLVMYFNEDYSGGERYWFPLSVNSDGIIRVLEYSYRSWYPNSIYSGIYVNPRVNYLELMNLSEYSAEYALGGYEEDSDGDGYVDSEDAFPNNAAIAVDTDGDGLADDYVAGCDVSCQGNVVVDNDDDNDGLLDSEDDSPLDPSNAIDRPALAGELVMPLGEANAMPVVFAFDESSTTYSVTPITGGPTVTWGNEYRSVKLYQLPDMNGNGAHEYGLFGIRSDEGNEEKLQFYIRDSVTGNKVSTLNWVANWSLTSIVVLDDVTGDGITDIGLQGYFKEGFRPQLAVKDGLTNASHQTYSFPNLWDNAQYVGFSDVTGDGVPEVALYGEIKRNGKRQVKVVDGTDKNNKLKAYTFPANWTDTSWHNMGDYDGDGEDDWGLLGHAIADGRWQLVIKNGVDPKGAEAIYAWPDMSDVTLLRLADANGDGIEEIALGGLNTSGRWQMQIKDGQDRNNTIKNITWPDNWSDTSLHVIGDVDGDGQDEVALLGKDNSYELVIKLSGSNYTTESTLELGSDWAEVPTISEFDLDGDGTPEWVAWGLNGSNEVQVTSVALP